MFSYRLSKLLLFFLTFFANALSAQIEVTGSVFDASSQEPLAYATIASLSGDQGTLTNTDGAFIISVNSELDSLEISYLGYESIRLRADNLLQNPRVNIQAQQIELTDITVIADDDYLYQAIAKCRRTLRNATTQTARTYFQLVTNSSQQPIEMIQAYYNTDLSQRGIEHFRLKNGRVAMALQDNGFFVNLSTTQAITQMDLFDLSGAVFNSQPLQLGLGALRRKYELNRLASLSNPDLYHIEFTPKEEGKELFSGEIWIDKNDFSLHKLILRDDYVEKHPFYSVFAKSTIARLGLDISFNFERSETGMRISHINWNFEVNMVETVPTPRPPIAFVQGEGVLYFYDYNKEFWEPFFQYDHNHNDYRKISFLPYNSDFWEANHGLVYSDRQRAQMQFFANNGFLMNHFQLEKTENRFFEFNNPHWNPGLRVKYREPDDLETDPILDSNVPLPNHGNLPGIADVVTVQLFLDVNQLGDSLQYSSATVLDIFKTHASPPYDSVDHAILNIYFDLCELERRKLMVLIQALSNPDIEAIRLLHQQATQSIAELHKVYFREVRGVNKKRMLRSYNAYVLEHLGIDNLAVWNVDL